MALLAFEKAPFSAIFSLPIEGADPHGPWAGSREWGQLSIAVGLAIAW